MDDDRGRGVSRREFVRRSIATAVVVGARPTSRASAEPPPETTKLRLVKEPSICIAPQYAAEQLLRAEGFTDIEYVTTPSEPYRAAGSGSSMWGAEGHVDPVAAGLADLHTGMVGRLVVQIDAGEPIRILTGIHAGCFELFSTDRVRSPSGYTKRGWCGALRRRSSRRAPILGSCASSNANSNSEEATMRHVHASKVKTLPGQLG